MPATSERTPAHRPTLSDQNARYYELLMAQATKAPRQGAQSTEWGERTTGPTSGHLYFKSVQLVQREDESDLQFLGRQEDALRQMLAVRDKLNAETETAAQAATGKAVE